VYRDSTAVLGPLAAYVEPHCYDLCEKHAARLVVPRGWDVVRLPPDPVQERADDLEAIANVVRENAGPGGSRPGRRPGGQGSLPGAPGARQQPADPRQPSPARQQAPGTRQAPSEPVGQGIEVGRRGHLRVVRSVPQES
jgi:hypothetical protein